jgi:hypothetical protein
MDLEVFKGFPVLPWLLWCTAVTGVLLIGIAFRLLIDSMREHRYAEMLFAGVSADYLDRLAEHHPAMADGPPKGPPNIDVYG